MSEISHVLTDDLVCPYCGHAQSDSWECGESSEEYHCGECHKKFSYETETYRTFTSRKVDCLNGAEHDWKKLTYPDYPDAKRCRSCHRTSWLDEQKDMRDADK